MVSPIRTSAWIQIDELIPTHSNSDVKGEGFLLKPLITQRISVLRYKRPEL